MTRNNDYMGNSKHYFRWAQVVAVMVAMMMPGVLGIRTATAQEGLWYIANYSAKSNPTYTYNAGNIPNNFYMVPAKNPTQADSSDAYFSENYSVPPVGMEKPYITTYRTSRDVNSAWVIKSAGDGKYFLIHVLTGKYVVYKQTPDCTRATHRKAVHLETLADPDNTANAKFVINNRSYAYSFRPQSLSSGHRFLNPAGGDKPYYNAQGGDCNNTGLVGVYSDEADGGSNWVLEEAHLAAPDIRDVDDATNTVTIADVNELPAGYEIRYTTDGSTVPTASIGTVYSGPIAITANMTIKAVVVRYGFELTSVASKTVSPVLVKPTVTNNFDGTITLSTPTPGEDVKMYYTTDGSNPSSTSTLYTAPFSLGAATIIKAITYLGESYSDVTTYNVPPYTTPTITFDNTTSKATITCTGATNIYYTTNGDTPTTSSTSYSAPITLNSTTTVKAIATHAGYLTSEVGERTISQVATPTIQNNGSNAISITCATEGASIYYTTDGSTPTTSSSEYTVPMQEGFSGVTFKAIAVKEDMITSAVGSGSVTLQCATPVITRSSNTSFTVTCAFPTTGVTIYYTTGDGSQSDPTESSSSTTSGGTVSCSLPVTVKAFAKATNYENSTVTTVTLNRGMGGDGSVGNPYTIEYQDDVDDFITKVNTDATEAAKHYKVIATGTLDFSSAGSITQTFTGSFDGGTCILTGLTHSLFNTVDGGVVKNVTLKGVAISSDLDTLGAIACIAKGYSRIYNCGILPNTANFPDGTHPTVTTSGKCAGGLVGSLRDDSRVINCYSYADVRAANTASGIVGRNAFESTAEVTDGKYTKLRTAVVNNMFYGDILGGTNQYGVYGGKLITNAAATGISSYNYFRNGSTFTATNGHKNTKNGSNNIVGNPTAYNCSFPAEERYLTQVEFHRSLLNSNRELCGWWVKSDVAPSTMSTTDVQAIAKDASIIYKWVVDPSLAPYPILKPFGKYPSVVNGNTGTPWFDRSTANPYEGKQLGTLIVTVQSGAHSSAADQTLYIPITDMDTLHYDFGYRKVQLPYFNTVFGDPDGADWTAKYAGNYTDYVVTGWKVTAVTGGTQGTFVENWETGYNFADRNCTDKDKYSVSGRVFAQGGNYYVPDGVTAITIEAYWGKAIYVRNADASYDRVNVVQGSSNSPNNYFGNGSHFAPAGTRDNNVNGATIQTASTKGSIRDALTAITAKGSVYDYALVLVGNIQEAIGKNDVVHASEATRGFTLMSVDLDFDEEPDYCLEWQLGQNMARQVIAPIRFDFLPVIELGIAGKVHNSTYFYSLGCYRSKGHFEVTETAFIRFGQFEFELGSKDGGRDEGPIILNGGIYDQYCRGRNEEKTQNINYVILGGHVVMPSFTPGAHVNANALYQTRHCAVNALGGDFSSFYLTGGYNEGIAPYNDNPHCYIDGGRFGTVAAAYKEGIAGNVYWRINHALIREFYGGGVMSQSTGANYKIVKGNIDVVIDNSIVGKYCGGPKFGDMVTGKTVTTSATGTTFGYYYGAGNGGTNYVQYKSTDNTGVPFSITVWNDTVNRNYHPGVYRSSGNAPNTYEADYDYEVINYSTGDGEGKVVNRSYYYSAQFATTNTGKVTSTLTGCTVLNNFYGAGFLGGVSDSVISTLTDTRVMGSAFGAGYSAASGTVTISSKDKTAPVVNTYTGMIKPQSGGTSTTYTWTNTSGSTDSPITGSLFYTEIPLTNLGAVNKTAVLTINGNSEIGTMEGEPGSQTLMEGTGNVYGGGDQSAVTGNTIVKLQGNATVHGDVFGGGNNGTVGGNSSVTIQNAE